MCADKPKKILLEVMYKADYCLPCYYMDEAICETLPKYSGKIEYWRVKFMKGEGKKRFLELSVSLFGEEGVCKYIRIAPVPSIFIDGELVFDVTPGTEELKDYLDKLG